MTLDSILEWDAVAGATSYEIKVLDASGNQINTSVPSDSDVNGLAETILLSYPVSKYLIGKPAAVYKFSVRAKAAGLVSAFADIFFTYTGLATPANLRFS